MNHDTTHTILVVDDEPLVTELLGQVLSECGANVLLAHSGLEALCILDTQTVDVVLSDICMGGMDGFELLQKITLLDSAINVILMTGYDSHQMVKRAIAAGAYDYLCKPLDDHSIIVSVTDRAAECTSLTRQNALLIEQLTRSNRHALAVNRRLTELNEKLQRLSVTDELTQLYNRRYIDEWLRTLLGGGVEQCCSVILMDIDYFKSVNDTFGHASGDLVLQELAHILHRQHRQTDLVGRYGGEEFVIVLPGCYESEAMLIAERVRRNIEKHAVDTGDELLYVTVSMGVATSVLDHHDISDESVVSAMGCALMAQADLALYAAKNNGRNLCLHASALENRPDQLSKAS